MAYLSKTTRGVRAALKGISFVLKRWAYLILAAVISLFFGVIVILLPNYQFIISIWSSRRATISEKWNLALSLLGSFSTNMDLGGQISLVVIAILAGINLSLFFYYLFHRFRLERMAGTSLLGMIVGVFGVGCASCGAVILSSVLGVGAALQVIAWLPFRGAEFTWLSILLLLWAIYNVAKRINDPLVCPI